MSLDVGKQITWIDPRNCDEILICGFLDNQNYLRIPSHHFNDIKQENPALPSIISQTSGGMLKFRTNTEKLLIKAEVEYDPSSKALSKQAMCGFDIYIYDDLNNEWNYLNVGCCEYFNEEVVLFDDIPGDKEIIINFPLFGKVNKLLIGISESAIIKKPMPFITEGKFVFYGTSITQGANASRPGNNYVSTLSRFLNIETINLGFSGNGLGEPSIRSIIKKIKDMKMLIIDYDANAGAAGTLYTTLKLLIDEVRVNYPNIPIVVISRIPYILESYSETIKKALDKRRSFQQNIVKEASDQHLYYIDGNSLLPKNCNDCFSDQIHLNDLGFYLFSQNLLIKLKEIVSREGVGN